jgi:hypothetical protein
LSQHISHEMGKTAVAGARRWVNPNPYTRGSFVTHGGFSSTPNLNSM